MKALILYLGFFPSKSVRTGIRKRSPDNFFVVYSHEVLSNLHCIYTSDNITLKVQRPKPNVQLLVKILV